MILSSSPSDLVPYFDHRLQVFVTPAPDTRIVDQNSSRVALIVSINGGSINVSPEMMAGEQKGIRMGSDAGLQILTFRDIGALVCSEWFVNSQTGTDPNVTVIEVSFRPSRGQ